MRFLSKPMAALKAVLFTVTLALAGIAYAAAGNFIFYSEGLLKVIDGTIDPDTDALRMVLVTSTYTPNQNTDTAWSAISANEVSGTGYTANGKLLTCTTSRASNVITLDCDDQSWTSSTITAKYAVIMHDANGDGTIASTDVPLFYVDLDTGGGSISTTNGTFTVTINASGVYTITAATS